MPTFPNGENDLESDRIPGDLSQVSFQSPGRKAEDEDEQDDEKDFFNASDPAPRPGHGHVFPNGHRSRLRRVSRGAPSGHPPRSNGRFPTPTRRGPTQNPCWAGAVSPQLLSAAERPAARPQPQHAAAAAHKHDVDDPDVLRQYNRRTSREWPQLE